MAQAPSTNKGKSSIPNVIEGAFDSSSGMKVSKAPRRVEGGKAPHRVKVNKAPCRIELLVEGKIDHYNFGNTPQGENPTDLEELLKQLEVEEQTITGKHLTRILDDKDQLKSSRRLSSYSSKALERYDIWANLSLLEEPQTSESKFE
jgi:hypothetical protein